MLLEMVRMTLGVPNERVADPSALEALVLAVRDAHASEPETRGIEWKSTLDLSDPRARFSIARHLLGFANREVAAAQRYFDGYAYLLIGVEPGRVLGIDLPDPADLNNALAQYVPQGRVSWDPFLVELDGKTILILEIPPPRPGDTIATLQRAYDTAPEGRIFIRRPGQTAEASPEEITMLERRLLAPTDEDRRARDRREELDRERMEIDRRRELLEAQGRAEARAADFRPLPSGEAFVLDTSVSRLSGTLINAGGSTTVTDVRLHIPGAAIPGGVTVQYPTNVRQAVAGRLPVDVQEHMQLRFSHDALSVLAHSSARLTVEISFIDQDGWAGIQKVQLGRSGSDPNGRLRWTARPEHSLRAPLTAPPAA